MVTKMVTKIRQQKKAYPPRMLLLTTLFQSLPCNWHYSFLWMPCATGGRTDYENEKEQLAMEGREGWRKANCKASAAKQRRGGFTKVKMGPTTSKRKFLLRLIWLQNPGEGKRECAMRSWLVRRYVSKNSMYTK